MTDFNNITTMHYALRTTHHALFAVFGAALLGVWTGCPFASEPISYRMNVLTSEIEFYDGRPRLSYTSESANYNAAQNFTLPIGGVPTTLSLNAAESESLAGDIISRNTHSNISFSSAMRDTTLTANYNETGAENLIGGDGLKNVSKNSSMSVSMNEQGLPPIDVGLSEAEAPGTRTSSFRFLTSHSFDSTSVNFNQFENQSEAIGRPKSETTYSSFSLTNNRNPGKSFSLSNTLGLDWREADSGIGQQSDGFTKRLTTSFSYSGIEGATLRGSYGIYDDTNNAPAVTTKEKYNILSLFSTVQLAEEIYLNVSHSKTSRKEPQSSTNESDSSNASLSKSFGNRLSFSYSHSEQESRSNTGGGAAKTETDALSVNAILGNSMLASFNVSESAGQTSLDMRFSFDMASNLPVDYHFTDAGGAESHTVSTHLSVSESDSISIFYSTQEAAGQKSNSLAYAYSGYLRNQVNFSFSFGEQNAAGLTSRTTGVNLSLPVGRGNLVDFSVNNSRNDQTKSTTSSIGVSGRL